MSRIAALVLAAGQSTRMGAANKLLTEIEGVAMVARVVTAAQRTGRVFVVTGHEAEAVRAAVAGMTVEFVHNPDYAEGLSTSLAAGLKALPDDIDGAVICLGDMPWVGADVIDALIAAFDDNAICLPIHKGRRGNPVLWARRYFAEMQALTGDRGARQLIYENEEQVREVECGDGVLRDVDRITDAGGPSTP